MQGAAQYSNTKELGKLLYSQYLYPLEIAAVILLVAIIAAIALTLRQRKDSKYTEPVASRCASGRATACASSSWPPTRRPNRSPAPAAAETKA